MRSQAASQLSTGPAHAIGVPCTKTRSPVKTVRASGTYTTESLCVCAGPRSVDLDVPATHRERQRACERPIRLAAVDLAELEVAEGVVGELPEVVVVGVLQRVELRRREVVHLLGRRHRGVDLGSVGDELVAVAVVAVGVRVDERVDRPRARDRAHGVEHLPGQTQVEQRVHEQRGAVAGDEARVAVAPGAARLQVGPEAVGELVQPLREVRAHGTPAPLRDHSASLASSAPWASASSFSHATSGSTRPKPTNVPKPQSVPGMTRSRPTTSAKRPMRCATSSGCSTKLVFVSMTPGHEHLVVGELSRPSIVCPLVS